VPAGEKFPRTQKFLLGDRIQMTAFGVLESRPTRATARAISRAQTWGLRSCASCFDSPLARLAATEAEAIFN
jgi:hypothetical protein